MFYLPVLKQHGGGGIRGPGGDDPKLNQSQGFSAAFERMFILAAIQRFVYFTAGFSVSGRMFSGRQKKGK